VIDRDQRSAYVSRYLEGRIEGAMHETFSTGLNKLSPTGVAEAIRTMRDTGISLYVHGGPGISKSSVALQVANEENIAFIDFRLTQMAPEDVRGVPVPGEVDHMKGIIWVPPLVFPRDLDFEFVERIDDSGMQTFRFFNPIGNNGIHYCTDPVIEVSAPNSLVNIEVIVRPNSFTVQLRDDEGEPCYGTVICRVTGKARAMLALEEFNSAPPSVMAAAYQLILDRRLGDYVVPNGVMLLAMGNRDTDRGVTFQLPKPVANRFIHVEMEFKWEDWFAWAGNNGIHSEILGYLSKWPSKTNDFDPDSPQHSFATPRSWEFVSKIISGDTLPSKDTLRALICGAVGDAIGAEFVQHRKFMADMPDVADILDGKITTFKTANPQFETQIAYSVCVQMCHELRARASVVKRDYPGNEADANFNKFPARRQWLSEADRGFSYAIDNFRPDVTIMAARLSIGVHKLKFSPVYMPRFAEFCDSYREMIMS
jgi:hypothetical protein